MLKLVGISALVLLLGLVLAGGLVYASIVRNLPDPEGKAQGRDQTSVVYDRNGEELAKLFADQNRTDRPLAEMPEALRNGVIATEDSRFFEHSGVDPIGIARALWTDIRTRSVAQGGSTITQQYVKNAFITPEQTLRRKISEAILAYRIEKKYSKERVLELYLNTIYFGHGAYGVEAASQAYFGKSVTELDLAECAMIAGVIKSPGRYSPYLDPEEATNRRATVLRQMTDQGMITETERAEAAGAEFALAGLGNGDAIAPYFMEYIKAQLIDEFGAEAVFRGGISVTTTLDLKMQRAAERAVAEALDQADDPSAALVALDPQTGEVLAMVGGRDFAEQQFNVAVQGQGRQPGSAFKPFVLVTALQEGVTSEDTFEAGPSRFTLPNGQTWKVTGASGNRTGPMRLREAMEKSVNSVFARLILDVGPSDVVDTAHAMGITNDIKPVPAIALGGHEQGVTPLDMASAYGTLAAGGTHAEPFSITSVTSGDGQILLENTPQVREALDPAVAYLTTDILRGVISRGTGGAAGIGRPAAGKTGTTQKYRDAWFVGYTPDLVAAVWVGYPEAQQEMTDVHGRRVTGGSFPAEIWAAFMKGALEGRDSVDFQRPGGLTNESVCRESGELSTEWCEDVFTGLFLAGVKPGSCSIHTGPETVVLPELIGLTKERAIAELTSLGLEVRVTEEEVRGVSAGIVARHDPVTDTEVEVGSTVSIVVSTGARTPPPPTASFTISPDEPLIDQPVSFDASASSSEGDIVLYLWEFGDETEGEGVEATHTFAQPGIYGVVLWVTDSNDQTSSVTRQIVVR
ncbi:MAG: PBP1A family penicillin-binding protein [Anaerosomatales bacterium]|nr:PBP1A family penicillin-binding protein [Anaerosomatales bacterium]MDT8434844.1 PBP1A family penicillin-binding protein [Anaerosomatales bacterium]